MPDQLITPGANPMHFRERNRMVQVIRTTYDPARQKGRPEIVARLSKAKPAITDEVRKVCTPDELLEIQAWIAANSPVPARSEAVADLKGARRLAKGRNRRQAAAAASPRGGRNAAAAAQSRWENPKAGMMQLLAQLDQATLWFRRNPPTEERKLLAADLALRLQRVRVVLRKKGWIAQKAALGKTE
ncbi:MAG: hypothetical protein ACT4QA_23675 [Panacagrimonas sp.]